MTSAQARKREDLPFNLFEINLSEADKSQLIQISEDFGLALDHEDMKRCKKNFSEKSRNPTDVELQTIAQTWSEHCYHRTFKGNILLDGRKINLLDDYIKKSSEEISPPWCVSIFKDNAGIIEFDDNRSIAAKVETHNHPSAIEPFGGAATGIGGVVRDILGVWGRPVANTDVLCFGPQDYNHEKLPPGTKHPKYLLRGVTKGISFYGNNMGIPTVNGAICFDESYVGNVVVYCGCIGTLPTEKYEKNPEPGNVIVLAGGKTGKDGIHGVTFASVELTEESEEASRPAVQIADPIEEEKLRRAIISVRNRGLGTAITDLGGGGLSSAVGETAYDGGCGARVKVDKVPLKHSNMDPWEIWISESQERMLLTVEKENLKEVLEIFDDEEVEATPIGEFTDDGHLEVFYKGEKVAHLELKFLFSPPKVSRKAKWKKPELKEPKLPKPENYEEVLLRILSSPDIASKESIIRTYDHEVQGNTALKPLQGKRSGPNDAAVLKPFKDSWRGVVISSGIKPTYGKIDPYWMAASSIEEAVRNNVAVGGRRISLLDNFTWGNPEKSEQLGKLVRACKGCYDLATSLETPFISGKDSLYNESPHGSVTPTLLITAVGIIPDVRTAISMELKDVGNLLYILGETRGELGGSEYYKLNNHLGKKVPRVRTKESRRKIELIPKAIDNNLTVACHDLSEGGLGVAASEMALTGNLGLELDLKAAPSPLRREDFILFSETNGRFLMEVPPNKKETFENLMADCTISQIGKVTNENHLSIKGTDRNGVLSTKLSDLREAWQGGLNIE